MSLTWKIDYQTEGKWNIIVYEPKNDNNNPNKKFINGIQEDFYIEFIECGYIQYEKMVVEINGIHYTLTWKPNRRIYNYNGLELKENIITCFHCNKILLLILCIIAKRQRKLWLPSEIFQLIFDEFININQ